MNADGFWNNQETAKGVVSEMKLIKAATEPIQQVLREIDDVRALYQLGSEAGDPASLEEADQQLAKLEHRSGQLELQSLLDGPNDPKNCFFSIQAGQGGTEAQDWAEMLLRMYLYYFERRGWDVSEIARNFGEQAGIKDVLLHVKGAYAFGYLKVEAGAHRLVRPSPFNAQNKRQTSFAGVKVVPEFEDADADVDIPETDLEIIAFVRASGPGGQNVNKVASAVRITHKPTGLQVVCTSERSQVQNRALALNLIKAKLQRLEEAKRDAELAKLYGEKGEISFGSQIRSYVMDDRRVKDHRNGYEVFQPDRVLDGDVQPFIDAQLRFKALGGKAANV